MFRTPLDHLDVDVVGTHIEHAPDRPSITQRVNVLVGGHDDAVTLDREAVPITIVTDLDGLRHSQTSRPEVLGRHIDQLDVHSRVVDTLRGVKSPAQILVVFIGLKALVEQDMVGTRHVLILLLRQ